MEDERVYLTADEAIRMLPDGDMIHTYRQGGGFVLIGADWERERLVEKIASGKPEFAGENATRSGHGLAIVDEHGPLYIETKRQTEEQRLTAELAALRAELEQARADLEMQRIDREDAQDDADVAEAIEEANQCLLCARMLSIKRMMDTIEAMSECGEYLDDDLTEAFNALDDAFAVHKHYQCSDCAKELADHLYKWDATTNAEAKQAGEA